MDFEKLRSDPRVAYLLGVGIGVALGLVIAARLRPQEALQAMHQPCPDCERTRAERLQEIGKAWMAGATAPRVVIDSDAIREEISHED